MAYTDSEIDLLRARVELAEEVINKLQALLVNVATIDQLRQINLIRQEELDEMGTAIEDLQAEVAELRVLVTR